MRVNIFLHFWRISRFLEIIIDNFHGNRWVLNRCYLHFCCSLGRLKAPPPPPPPKKKKKKKNPKKTKKKNKNVQVQHRVS